MKVAYDVGAFDGSDSAHYLKMGYRVVAIEASPPMAAELSQRFAPEIRDGRYTMLNIGVGELEGVLPFFISPNPLWSSFEESKASRDGQLKVERIDVPMRRLGSVIREYGEPDYVKIDVEGLDHACVRAMDCQPAYLSYEVDKSGAEEMIFFLAAKGYNRFSLVDQSRSRPITIPTPGTLSHLKWGMRQWVRWQLRARPYIHKTIKNVVTSIRYAGGRKQHAANKKPATIAPILTPMEHDDGWYTLADYYWLYRNVVHSGIIDSSWFDVHARRV